MNKDKAKKMHKDFFGHSTEKEMSVDLYPMSNLTFLGEAYAIEYIAKKHEDSELERYRHEFDNVTLLFTNGHELICYSPADELKITKRGIEG
jgi:hypothetical protein